MSQIGIYTTAVLLENSLHIHYRIVIGYYKHFLRIHDIDSSANSLQINTVLQCNMSLIFSVALYRFITSQDKKSSEVIYFL